MVTDFFTASFGPAQGATGSTESRLRGSSGINPNLKMDYCYCGHLKALLKPTDTCARDSAD